MHVNIQHRFNKEIDSKAMYYRLKESYRDVRGNVHSLIVLNIGFEPSLQPNDIRRIAQALSRRMKTRENNTLFGDWSEGLSELERAKACEYWQRMIDEQTLDRFDKREQQAKDEAERYIDLDTVEHTEAREVGAEWLCKQTIDKLALGQFLASEGWSEKEINTALAALIVRTVYSQSEAASYRILRDNSAACELCSGSQDWYPGINSLYTVTDKLFGLKEKLEKHLCSKTDSLFNLENRIVLFDLTNFYFEGRKATSEKAKFGRSKEKRYDCRLLVLALCINTEGFIRYSSILEGNMSDPKSLPDMIEKLSVKVSTPNDRTLVVMDAGIATEDNLALIKEKGYNYLCVSRTKLKDYALSADHSCVTVKDSRKRDISLHRVASTPNGDHYLEITSPSKAMTEASMNRQWRQRFEAELERINHGIQTKGGTKAYDKVIERTGRAIQKYPSISKYYNIEYVRSEEKPTQMAEVKWDIKDLSAMESGHGVYFLRTNVLTFDEKTTWDYYNLIREIESTNRSLKNDLNLRPIYHQKDERSDAHIFFGLLAYWIVNTIRYQLKQSEECSSWKEILRRMSTQKLVTTTAINALGDKVEFRQCSRPSKQAAEIYQKLNLKEAPFKKQKICRTQKSEKKLQSADSGDLRSH